MEKGCILHGPILMTQTKNLVLCRYLLVVIFECENRKSSEPKIKDVFVQMKLFQY